MSVSRAGRPGGTGANSRRRRFLVEFSGDTFADVQKSQDITANLWAAPGNILGMRSFLSPDRKTYRVHFDVEAGSDTLMEMRLILEMQGKPISETWLYRWTA